MPPILLSVILLLMPITFRALVHQQGVATGNDRELGVQQYYFIFLFVQVFFIATLSTGLTAFLANVLSNPVNVISALADNLPKASNYFFSYLIVQALGNSAGALLQVGTLLFWFIIGPITDSTARAKWRRQTNLQTIQWGSFYPPFTNFAVIGIIYSIISPLIMVFNLISFSLYWVVQRYNVLYVYSFAHDTGGLLFPTAVNQLFTGIYVMEICLIALFFLQKGADDKEACIPQAVIMIIALIFTAVYQYLLNIGFQPLLRYLPITLEDEAVIRDEEFARAEQARWRGLTTEEPDEGDDIEDQLEDRERKEQDDERAAQEAEHQRIRQHCQSSNSRSRSRQVSEIGGPTLQDTKPPTWKSDRWKVAAQKPVAAVRRMKSKRERSKHESQYTATREGRDSEDDSDTPIDDAAQEPGIQRTSSNPHIAEKPVARGINPHKAAHDVEAQKVVGDVLFSGYSDELEDLTPEERDTLVRYSFQHAALRARRPVVWIPRDPLGVSDDEIKRTKEMSTVGVLDGEKEAAEGERKTNIWISNEGTAVNAKGKVMFKRSPPDFENVDLIQL